MKAQSCFLTGLLAKQQSPWFPLILAEFTGLTDTPQLSFTWEFEAMKN